MELLLVEKINLPTFDKNIFISKDVKKLYRFWFSFIDPLIISLF